MKKKKFLVGLLVVAMGMSAVGCSNEKKEETTSGNSTMQEGEVSKDSVTAEGDVSQKNDKSGEMLVSEKPVEVEFVISASSPKYDPKEMKFFTDMEQKTNLKINWIVIPNQVLNEKIGILFASTDLPDGFYGGALGNSEIYKYGEQGALMPLGDLIDKHAPNIKKAFEERPDILPEILSESGKIYAFPDIKMPNPGAVVHSEMLINQKWLDNLALEMPTTTDEFYEVLTAFKEKDADGDGNADNEIPFGYGEWYGLGCMLPGAFDVVNQGAYLYLNESDEFEFIADTDRYKEYIKYMNKLYTEGLIDQEVFSLDSPQYKGKSNKGQYGALTVYGGWNEVGMENLENGMYRAVPPLEGPTGVRRTKLMSYPDKGVIDCNELAISSKTKYAEEITKWVDHFYNQELDIKFEADYGPLGINLTKNETGYIEYLPTPEGMSYGDFRSSEGPGRGPGYVGLEKGNNIERAVFENIKSKMDEEAGYIKYATNKMMPALKFIPQEESELAILTTDLVNYISNAEAQFIVGEKSIDDGWDQYVQQIEKLGKQKLVDIYNASYDRYLSRLK